MKSKGEERFYRRSMKASDLVYFNVKIEQSDLLIGAKKSLVKQASDALTVARKDIKDEITKTPSFLTSYYPVLITGAKNELVYNMYSSSAACGVGPMAAVAGATAEYVGRELAKFSDNVIVENGGDIFIKTDITRKVMLYAGQSSLSGKIALEITSGTWGICTSAYTVGHSYSDGRCDAAVVISHNASLADAAATALGNSIKNESQIERGVKKIMKIDGVLGAVAIINEKVAALGDVTIRSI